MHKTLILAARRHLAVGGGKLPLRRQTLEVAGLAGGQDVDNRGLWRWRGGRRGGVGGARGRRGGGVNDQIPWLGCGDRRWRRRRLRYCVRRRYRRCAGSWRIDDTDVE